MNSPEQCHVRLGQARKGFCGIIISVGQLSPDQHAHETDAAKDNMAELERRLLEIGIVEGARVEILHEGPIGHDPIALRVDDMRVAIRREQANTILVCPEALLT